MMEAPSSSEMLVLTRATQSNIPQDGILHIHHRENLRSFMTIFYCLNCDSPNLEDQVPVFASPRKRVAQLHPQALGSVFSVSYNMQRCPSSKSKSKSKSFYDQQSVGQSALVSDHHPEPATNFSFTSMEIIFRQSGDCYYGEPPLMRGWVCNLQLLLYLTSAIFLGSESQGNNDHILLSQFWDSQTWKASFLYLFFFIFIFLSLQRNYLQTFIVF
jgi:hypothetical protein